MANMRPGGRKHTSASADYTAMLKVAQEKYNIIEKRTFLKCTKHLIHHFLPFSMALHLASVASFEVKLILNVNTGLTTANRYQV